MDNLGKALIDAFIASVVIAGTAAVFVLWLLHGMVEAGWLQ